MAPSITIELFSVSTCGRCGKTKECVRSVVDEFDKSEVNYRELDVLDEIDYAVSLGILTTPSIAINGELIFTAPPSIDSLREAFKKRLRNP